MIELTEAARVTAGIVALSVVAIESGGAFLLRVVTGKEQATEFQKSSSGRGTPTRASWSPSGWSAWCSARPRR